MAFRNPVRSLPASKITGQIDGATQIKAGSISTPQLSAGSVTTPILAAGSVTTPILSAGSVTTPILAAGSVTTPILAAGSVTTPILAAGSVSADRLTVGMSGSIGQKFYDTGSEASRYSLALGSLPNSVAVPDAPAGGFVMRTVGWANSVYRPDVKIPFDPGVLYRVTVVARQTVDHSVPGTNQAFYAGLMGWGANGTTVVNRTGGTAISSHHYFAAAGTQLVTANGWTRFTGYVRGWAAAGVNGSANPTPDPHAPGVMHADVRYVSPVFYINYPAGTGTAEVALFTIEVVETGTVGTVNIEDGAVSADKVTADVIDGKTVTGATVRTAASGRRIVLAPDGNTYWYTGATGEFAPGRIQSEGGATPALALYGPRMDDMEDYGIQLRETGASTTAVLNTDTTTVVGDMSVSGNFSAGNIAWGSVSVTPVANTNTSLTVTGLNLNSLGSYRVWLTINSAFPSVLKPATATAASSDGFTVTINRADTQPTNVWYLVLAK
jgi:hypothetical protein